MYTGKVKWFNSTKGYGFITPEEGGNDVFFHASGLADAGCNPQENDMVTYEIQERDGRKNAVSVSIT